MNTGTVSFRYAKALLQYAIDLNEEEQVYKDMCNLSHAYITTPQLRQMIDNPVLPKADKISLLSKAAGENPAKATLRFFELVAEKHRTNILQFIASSFETQFLAHKNVIKSRLITSAKVDNAFIEKMEHLVAGYTNGKVLMQVENRPSIGGGFILEYDTYCIDASVGNQIKNIRKSLMRAAGNS
jgi:F-type H+-transporting ATPase subunit delta